MDGPSQWLGWVFRDRDKGWFLTNTLIGKWYGTFIA
jgi:hypothetical protein